MNAKLSFGLFFLQFTYFTNRTKQMNANANRELRVENGKKQRKIN